MHNEVQQATLLLQNCSFDLRHSLKNIRIQSKIYRRIKDGITKLCEERSLLPLQVYLAPVLNFNYISLAVLCE